ncbi:DUF3383 family protein [Swingsia samuiensis]|uniref:DUF3383 family protein n=1 Tax=Swingsia samuiensis TaxID=1293412 RepID=A0A4Y6UIG4_9PROT|nr:DUF3383 family protein [Swingsia samuiensis]QDH17409.1 DUF3383 family protein [Swingsia samuiensis]
MAGIPISKLISVTPSVLTPGTGINQLTGLIISNSTKATDQKVVPFTSAASVATTFGATSAEYAMAQAYFSGTRTSLFSPNVLYIAGLGSSSSGITPDYLDLIAGQAAFTGFTTNWNLSFAEKQACAQWVESRNKRQWFVAWDNDQEAITQGSSKSFGSWLQGQSLNGTTVLYDATGLSAAGALGWMASIDFTATNGRTGLSYQSNGNVTPTVIDGTTARTLEANGYNYYGSYDTQASSRQWFYPGTVSGSFGFADSYINQIWLNTSLQNALVNMMQTVKNIPFNALGDSYISSAVQDTINQAVTFGAIRDGVNLAQSQIQNINSQAGNTSAAQTLATRGWYFIPGASKALPFVRTTRGPITPVLFYTDGGSVQTIKLAAVEVQ